MKKSIAIILFLVGLVAFSFAQQNTNENDFSTIDAADPNKEELLKRGAFEKLGGQPFFASLVAEVPTTANVGYHSDIVREKSIRRRLIDAGSRIVSLGYSSDLESAMIMDEAERAVFEVSQNNNRVDFRPVRDILGETFQKIEQRYQQSGSDVSGFESSETYVPNTP